MITTAPRLRTRRPSPSTAEFTVTTSPTPTLPLRALRILLLAIRLFLATATTLFLHTCWTVTSPLSSPPRVYAYQSHPAGSLLVRLASSLPLGASVLAALAAFYLVSLRVHADESLLVLRGLGVQTTESPRTYLAGAATRFIPTEKIQDVFVNEAFRGFEVRYYLVVVVEGEEHVVVVFPGLLPRRKIVEEVWRGVRECLYERED